MKKYVSLFGVSLLLLLGACSNQTSGETHQSSSSDSHYPVTLNNYTKAEGGTEWASKEQTYKEVPTKVLVNTRPAAELLLHLGLKDKEETHRKKTF